jgi:quercetin dioxygenase-like cupin family protein
MRRLHVKPILEALVLFATLLARLALAQGYAPIRISPESLRWVSPPNLSGVHSAWVLGNEQQPGIYLLRVKLAPGARVPPHTHPDDRNSTVLSGTIYVGFGETFDEARMVAIPAGAVYVAPANVPHYIWAKDGDAQYQEAGIGPTGTVMLLTPLSETRSR